MQLMAHRRGLLSYESGGGCGQRDPVRELLKRAIFDLCHPQGRKRGSKAGRGIVGVAQGVILERSLRGSLAPARGGMSLAEGGHYSNHDKGLLQFGVSTKGCCRTTLSP